MKTCKLALAILWSVVAIGDIAMAVEGCNPTSYMDVCILPFGCRCF